MQVIRTLTTHKSQPGVFAPTLMLAQDALDMVDAYVHAATASEVNGFGYVKQLNATTFYVGGANELFITKQTATMGSADVDGVAYALAVDQAAINDRMPELRLQWHSHPGDAYFSDADLGNIENFGQAGAEWFISLVTNRRGEIHARFDSFNPVRFGVEMEVQVYRNIPDDLAARAATDVEKLVTVRALQLVTKAVKPRRK